MTLLVALLLAQSRPDYVAALVGKTFLRAIEDRDVRTAHDLCADRLNLDGRVTTGRDAVRGAIVDLVRRLPQGARFQVALVLPLPEAEKRFGPLPARLRALRHPDVVVVFGRLPRRGLAVFVRKVHGVWKVIGLTD